ncbi:MAG: hypothetical protein L3K07_03875 [Thermoplasmata archaeon]|nr:hypothetical protein [Thermoplasmata archaeon]
MSTSASARSSWATWGFFAGLLVFEFVLDIVGVLFDEILVPVELVLDAAVVLSILSSRPRPSSGRRLGASRRGLVHSGLALYWLLFFVFLAIAIWADVTVAGFPLIGGFVLLFFSFFQFVIFGAFALFGLYLTLSDRSRPPSGRRLGAR